MASTNRVARQRHICARCPGAEIDPSIEAQEAACDLSPTAGFRALRTLGQHRATLAKFGFFKPEALQSRSRWLSPPRATTTGNPVKKSALPRQGLQNFLTGISSSLAHSSTPAGVGTLFEQKTVVLAYRPQPPATAPESLRDSQGTAQQRLTSAQLGIPKPEALQSRSRWLKPAGRHHRNNSKKGNLP